MEYASEGNEVRPTPCFPAGAIAVSAVRKMKNPKKVQPESGGGKLESWGHLNRQLDGVMGGVSRIAGAWQLWAADSVQGGQAMIRVGFEFCVSFGGKVELSLQERKYCDPGTPN